MFLHSNYKNWCVPILIVLLFSLKSSATEKNPFYLSINYRKGNTKSFHRYDSNPLIFYKGTDIKLGWQSIGKKNWQLAYRLPHYGIGVNWCSFQTPRLGQPIATYFFTNFPQIKRKRFQFDIELNLGFSWIIKPIDLEKPTDFYIPESKGKFLFGFFLEQSFNVSNNLHLFISEGLAHYSNGALSYPNIGIDVNALKVGIRYQPRTANVIQRQLSILPRGIELHASVFTGTKILHKPIPYYSELSLSPSVNYRFGRKHRLGLCYEVAYNEAIEGFYPERVETNADLITQATSVQHNFIINKFTIFTQLGIYLKNKPRDEFYFERLGFGYYLFPNIRVVMNIKAHFLRAEYLETGLIFDLKKWSKKDY